MFDERRFKAQMILAGVTVKELSDMLDIDESTFYRKLKMGGAFTRKEINDMISILHISNPMDIFFTDRLAETQVTA